MNAEEKTRLLELQLRVWAYVARNNIRGNTGDKDIKELDVIPENTIESHGGRISKAIRLLSINGDIAYLGKIKNTECYKILTFEQSKASMKEPDCFISSWDRLYDRYLGGNSYSYSHNQHERLFQCGYVDIDNVADAQLLSVYWNKDLYDIESNELVYPKAQQENRIKGLLRSIVEHNLCVDGFRNKMEKRLGLAKDTLPTDNQERVSYRNCGFTLANMTQKGLTSHIDEYEFWVKYFTKLRDNTQALYKSIWQAGGYEVAVKQMREETIKELLYRAPLDSVKETNESDYSQDDDKTVALFILRNSAYWEYDTLYADDPSVMHCTDRTTEPGFDSEFEMPEQAGKLLGIEIPKDEERGLKLMRRTNV